MGFVILFVGCMTIGPMNNLNERYPFVHPSIAEILECKPCSTSTSTGPPAINFVDHDTLQLQNVSSRIDLPTLVEVAHVCDDALFQNDRPAKAVVFPLPLQGIIALLRQEGNQTSMNAVATLLAINQLESSVRRYTGYKAGKAPLLKNMLEQVTDEQVGPLLKTLLLPSGLNLRNLLWHGFLGELPRPWCSLVVVLLFNLALLKENNFNEVLKPEELPDLRCHSTLAKLCEESIIDQSDLSVIRSWLPLTHQGMFDIAIQWHNQYPSCTVALLCILLEHALRLEWSRVNHRPQDSIARPDSYYITLDGHGQRNQHDLILHPYWGKGSSIPNELVSHLGGGTIALLTDLFASSSGGPNIRATLAHGMWDAFLDEELFCMLEGRALPERLKDVVSIFLLIFKSLAFSLTISYKPLFSFSSKTVESIHRTLTNLEHLERVQDSQSGKEKIIEIPPALMEFQIKSKPLRHSLSTLDVVDLMGKQVWTCACVFEEYHSNVVLADHVAARVLLSDLVIALDVYIPHLDQALLDMQGDNLSNREHRRAMRTTSLLDCTISLYSFLFHTALEFLNGKSVMKMVERSRMVLSTYSTFLFVNSERAIKAALQFAQSKAVRLMLNECNKNVHQD